MDKTYQRYNMNNRQYNAFRFFFLKQKVNIAIIIMHKYQFKDKNE